MILMQVAAMQINQPSVKNVHSFLRTIHLSVDVCVVRVRANPDLLNGCLDLHMQQ